MHRKHTASSGIATMMCNYKSIAHKAGTLQALGINAFNRIWTSASVSRGNSLIGCNMNFVRCPMSQIHVSQAPKNNAPSPQKQFVSMLDAATP